MKAMKLPIHLKYEIIDNDQVIQTLEGPVNAPAGSAVLTGTKGERWPIPFEKFAATYDFDKHGSVCFKKPVQVEVKQMDTDFSVKVSWSEDLLYGKPGDYLVTYGPNDFGVVAKDVFEETYIVTFIPASEISS